MFWVAAFGAIGLVLLGAVLVGLRRAADRRAARARTPYSQREAMHAAHLAEAFPHTKEN